MKILKALTLIALVILIGCERIREVPEDVIILELNDTLVAKVEKLLPEDKDIPNSNPELFSQDIQKRVILKNASEVYVTFIDEGATFTNSLLWYNYEQMLPPTSPGEVVTNIVFPNISKVGEGGKLEPGFTIQLGTQKFPAGTVIAFALVADGWDNGSINYNKPTYYTDSNLNIDSKQHHILFKENKSGNLVIGFEDMSIGRDYNDILFSISDNRNGNASINFDQTGLIIK